MIFGEIIGSCSVFSPATTGIAFEESSDLVTDNPSRLQIIQIVKRLQVIGNVVCSACIVWKRGSVEVWKCGSVEVYFVEVWKCGSVLCGSFIPRCPVTRVVARSRPQPQHFPRIQLILVINRFTIIEIY